MSTHRPKGTFSRGRSGFTMIDPETELYSHKRGRAQHVAISYVWSEWKTQPADLLPDWKTLRARLLELVGSTASNSMKIATGHRRNCWLDSKCLDQTSGQDKAYWIPRMDQIYSEARCTVLLLRGIDLSLLVNAEKLIGCHLDHDDHSCLLTQSCASIGDWTTIDETSLIGTMKALFDGTWRRRAWIFQEILLSEEYIISADNNTQLALADCGVLAALLFRRHVDILWLNELAEWCRRLVYLRRRYLAYTLSDANILQMAQPLEATVMADKFYCLCGILRLKRLAYDPSHTADEALQAMVMELTRQGRMSWLYAIRPTMHSNLSSQLSLVQGAITSYFDHNINYQRSMYAKPRVSTESIGFTVLETGVIEKVIPMPLFLQESHDQVATNGLNFSPEQFYIKSLPRVLHRLATEALSPLLHSPCLERLRLAFGLEPDSPAAEVLWQLYALKESTFPGLARSSQVEVQDYDLAIKASWALKKQVASVELSYALILWRDLPANTGNVDMSVWNVAIGDIDTPAGAIVCMVNGSPHITFAMEPVEEDREVIASWKGALYPIWDQNSDNGISTKVLGLLKSRFIGRGPRKLDLRFCLDRHRAPP